ncbi:MAG: RluA family pseudouridine synthase [Bacteroidales bacterium]|nr:RluA family pseudouridine synthase [Bacteroidales bacterium]
MNDKIFHIFSPKEPKTDTVFNNPFYYQPDLLCIKAQQKVLNHIEEISDENFKKEIENGKMFGVLIAEKDNELGFLAAYSGQICGRENHDFFTPAVFDYLDENGYFKSHEREISEISKKLTSSDYFSLVNRIEEKKAENEKRISEYKTFMSLEKQKRDFQRENGSADLEKLITESQFQKAELKRMKEKFSNELNVLEAELSVYENLKKLRKQKSDALQNWLFSKFEMLNFKGEKKSVLEIFGTIPPAGTGECCAPKLLQYAFLNGYKPLKIAEFWYGKSPKGEIRKHLNFYPACNSKCKPILNFMLQGLNFEKNPLENLPEKQLEIIYDDDFLSVVFKPEGMLSCPDKKNQQSVLSVMRKKFPDKPELMICHRLDLMTSGLMIVAKTKQVFVEIQRQFFRHEIKKTYFAVLEGEVKEKSGKISLPLIADLTDRPRQKVDFLYGKESITDYEVIKIEGGETWIKFFPQTGRTHQLRVHAAHCQGLNAPIKGDELYGEKKSGRRMYLHAGQIVFIHPITGEKMSFEKESGF